MSLPVSSLLRNIPTSSGSEETRQSYIQSDGTAAAAAAAATSVR